MIVLQLVNVPGVFALGSDDWGGGLCFVCRCHGCGVLTLPLVRKFPFWRIERLDLQTGGCLHVYFIHNGGWKRELGFAIWWLPTIVLYTEQWLYLLAYLV